jgi:hypothetical protein
MSLFGNLLYGAVDSRGAWVHSFGRGGGATWRIYTPAIPEKKRVSLAWSAFASPRVIVSNTFGYRWDDQWVKRNDSKEGPLQSRLGDGSVVTYCWYRVADQPALLNADLTA